MTSSPRRRGAQPGNTNALQHGYYSAHFKNKELKKLTELSNTGLSDEIEMLRLVISRIVERASGEDITFDQQLRYLATISHAAGRLSHLVRTQAVLVGEIDEIKQALFTALENLPGSPPPDSQPHVGNPESCHLPNRAVWMPQIRSY